MGVGAGAGAGAVAVSVSVPPLGWEGRAAGSVGRRLLCLCLFLVLLWRFPFRLLWLFLSRQLRLELQMQSSWEGEVGGMGVSWRRRLPSADGRAGSGPVDIEGGMPLGECLDHVELEQDGPSHAAHIAVGDDGHFAGRGTGVGTARWRVG